MKKKPKSEFLALAERIAERPNEFGVPISFAVERQIGFERVDFLRHWFYPLTLYRPYRSTKNNEVRILILCFADLLWKDLKKKKK